MRRYSSLIVPLLITLAFYRGPLLAPALITITTVWFLLQIGVSAFHNRAKIAVCLKTLTQRSKHLFLQSKAKHSPKLHNAASPVNDPMQSLLVLHAGHRITVYLRSVYPDAIWEWCNAAPATAIIYGGSLRIRLFHVPEFNFAEVQFDDSANLICNLMRVTPFVGQKDVKTAAAQQTAAASKPQSQQCDPQVWFDIVGQRALRDLASDLSSHGYGGFFIKESGEVVVTRENEEIRKEMLKNFPSSVFWPAIAKLMEQSGYLPKIHKNGIFVSLCQKGAVQ